MKNRKEGAPQPVWMRFLYLLLFLHACAESPYHTSESLQPVVDAIRATTEADQENNPHATESLPYADLAEAGFTQEHLDQIRSSVFHLTNFQDSERRIASSGTFFVVENLDDGTVLALTNNHVLPKGVSKDLFVYRPGIDSEPMQANYIDGVEVGPEDYDVALVQLSIDLSSSSKKIIPLPVDFGPAFTPHRTDEKLFTFGYPGAAYDVDSRLSNGFPVPRLFASLVQATGQSTTGKAYVSEGSSGSPVVFVAGGHLGVKGVITSGDYKEHPHSDGSQELLPLGTFRTLLEQILRPARNALLGLSTK